LREAHEREKPLPIDPKNSIEPGVDVSEDFLRKNEEFLLFAIYSLLNAAVRTPGAVDTDALEALDALIKTHHTAESGLIYESRPENLVAAAVQRGFSASLADYEKIRAERDSLSPLRSKDVLRILVFLRRFGQHNLNGRPRGRMFLDVLRKMTPEERIEDRAPSIIL